METLNSFSKKKGEVQLKCKYCGCEAHCGMSCTDCYNCPDCNCEECNPDELTILTADVRD